MLRVRAFSPLGTKAPNILLSCLAAAALQLQAADLTVHTAVGITPLAGGDSGCPMISSDGQLVAFSSTANNLVLAAGTNPFCGQFPAKLNLYLRDRTTALTTLISVNSAHDELGNGDSVPAAMSPDGRLLLFESTASNLIAGDTNKAADLFIHDRLSATTSLVSVSTNGGFGNGDSRAAVMTPDGRYVAFTSSANNLVPNDTNGLADIFVRDLQTATTTLASPGAVGPRTGYLVFGCGSPRISNDGRFVAFFSTATNLVTGVAANRGDLYVRDLLTSATAWASSGALPALQAAFGATNAACCNHQLSSDGQFLVYEAVCFPRGYPSPAALVLRYHIADGVTELIHTNAAIGNGELTDLDSLAITPDGQTIAFIANATGDRNTNTCVVVWNAGTGASVVASVDLDGQVPTHGICSWPALDETGRYVSFMSTATNLVTNALFGISHLYRRDLQTGTTILANANSAGSAQDVGALSQPNLSANGAVLAFAASDGALVDDDLNHSMDVFVRDFTQPFVEPISCRHSTLSSLSANAHTSISGSPLSANGRLLTFASEADNLLPGVTNRRSHIYLLDRGAAGTNLLISVNTNGLPADGSSFEPAISQDGRYIVFSSLAPDLVAGDLNRASDVFLCDLQDRSLSVVSVSTSSSNTANGPSRAPTISTDGRFIYFLSRAMNLASGPFTQENVFMRDMLLGQTFAVSKTGTTSFSTTPDGRRATYYTNGKLYVWDAIQASLIASNTASGASFPTLDSSGNLVASLVNGAVLIWNVASGTVTNVSSAGFVKRPGLGFSSDGRFLTFASFQIFSSADTNNATDIYYFDRQTGNIALVSLSYLGVAGNLASDAPAISPDGRFIAYCSLATNLTPIPDRNGAMDVFLFDRETDATVLLTPSNFRIGTADSVSQPPVFSPDGRSLLLRSWASDLAPGDFNQTADLFMVDLYSDSALPVFLITIELDTSTSNGYWLTWPAVPGKAYRLEYKSSLSDLNWQPVTQGVVIAGSQGFFRDVTTAGAQRFFRVLAY